MVARPVHTTGAGGAWVTYLCGRVAGLLLLCVALVALTFLLVHAVPGDPARNLAGPTASAEQVEVVRQQLGVDRPKSQQAQDYLAQLVRGDLGESFVTGQPVSELVTQRLPLTASVALGGLLVVLFLGMPAGFVAAMCEHEGDRRRRRLRHGFDGLTGAIGAVPEYIMGTLLIVVLSLWLGWLPAQGTLTPQGMVLPALAVGLGPAAAMARIVRNETRQVLAENYMVTARMKRLSAGRLLLTHVLPNVATSSLTLGGMLVVALLGGTVIVENVFGIAGLGFQVVQSILDSDYPAIQGIILFLGGLAALVNFGVDILLGVLDPRVTLGSQS